MNKTTENSNDFDATTNTTAQNVVAYSYLAAGAIAAAYVAVGFVRDAVSVRTFVRQNKKDNNQN